MWINIFSFSIPLFIWRTRQHCGAAFRIPFKMNTSARLILLRTRGKVLSLSLRTWADWMQHVIEPQEERGEVTPLSELRWSLLQFQKACAEFLHLLFLIHRFDLILTVLISCLFRVLSLPSSGPSCSVWSLCSMSRTPSPRPMWTHLSCFANGGTAKARTRSMQRLSGNNFRKKCFSHV